MKIAVALVVMLVAVVCGWVGNWAWQSGFDACKITLVDPNGDPN